VNYFFLFFLLLTACSTPSKKICVDRVEFINSESIELNNNEKLFACGDPSQESWKEIPFSQSEFHLKRFLETRAYYHPTFQFKENKLLVDPGPILLANTIDFNGDPEYFQNVRIRKIINQPLNPELLNYIEASVIQRLKDMGYACPTVKLEAIKETGAIHVSVSAGPLYRFGQIDMDPIGLYPQAIRRFDAFSSSDQFRYEWMKLTQDRAENDGVVISSQLLYSCPQMNPDLAIQQILIGGDKRLVTIGVGASTEEIPIFQLSWKHVRTDQNGSSALITLYASQRDQQIKSTYFYYPFINTPRLHWDPALKLDRRNETTYRSTEIETAAPFSYQWDYSDDALKISSGPSLKRNFSDDSGLTKALTLLSYFTEINWFTHHYELYLADPQIGSSLDLTIEFLKKANFDMLGTVMKLNGIHLLKLNSVIPSQWILGFRYGANTTFVNERVTGTNVIPAQYLHTLGGDQNVRGFGRNELNINGIGAHTSAFGSLELRFAKTINFGIEPFTFFDFGALGEAPTKLDSSLYYSPGLGVRWQTPFGVIRSTLAHGYVAPAPDPELQLTHYQFFISFGREF